MCLRHKWATQRQITLSQCGCCYNVDPHYEEFSEHKRLAKSTCWTSCKKVAVFDTNLKIYCFPKRCIIAHRLVFYDGEAGKEPNDFCISGIDFMIYSLL